jgi:hypothetical protein
MVSASSHFIFSVLQDFTIVMEEKRNQTESVDDVDPASP